MRLALRSERGSGSVEHVALVALIALVIGGGVFAIGHAEEIDDGRLLGSAIARKTRCAVHHPWPCWQDPLTEAYGRELGGTIRALAPAPAARIGPDGIGLVGVDFRRCRQTSCAIPQPGSARLTTANRRTTAFTSVIDRRRSGDGVEISYWIYRPTLGWELIVERPDEAILTATSKTALLEEADPALVPLETLLGRDGYSFVAREEPPWRGKVRSLWGR